jgi:hypothetical protein
MGNNGQTSHEFTPHHFKNGGRMVETHHKIKKVFSLKTENP